MKKLVLGVLGFSLFASIGADNSLLEKNSGTIEDCLANPSPMEPGMHHYLGLFFGLDLNKSSYYKNNEYYILPLSFKSEKGTMDEYRFGFRPGIYWGLGWNWQHLYLGLELAGNYHWQVKNSPFRTMELASLSSDLLLGYLDFSRTWLYYAKFGLGGGWNRFSVVDKEGAELVKPKNQINLKLEGGIGAMWFVNKDCSIKYELLYGKNCRNNVRLTYEGNNEKLDFKLKNINSYMLNIGVAYLF